MVSPLYCSAWAPLKAGSAFFFERNDCGPDGTYVRLKSFIGTKVKRGTSISKRDFLQRHAAAAAAEAIGVPPGMDPWETWGESFRWVDRQCRHCSLACNVNVGMQDGKAIAVRGAKSTETGGVMCFEAANFFDPATRPAEYRCFQTHTRCVAGVVFKTAAGRARDVALRMTKFDGLEITGVDADSWVAAIWRRRSFASLENDVNSAIADDDVERLLPAFLGQY